MTVDNTNNPLSKLLGRGISFFGMLILIATIHPSVAGALEASDSAVTEQGVSSNAPQSRILFQRLEANTRFNYMDREHGGVTDRGLQYRVIARLQANLRHDGTAYLAARAETGKGFDNSWNNTAVELNPGQTIFNIKAVELHYGLNSRGFVELGGLDFDRGAGTDSIYASGDGHMTGYRAVFTGKSSHLIEKVSVTAAYLGDFDKPNFFSRARMDRANYLQLLVPQHWTKTLQGSMEVDSIHNTLFSRGAVHSQKLWIIENPRLEAVVRATDRAAFSWAASSERTWGQRATWGTNIIYADLPSRFYVVNGERVLLNRGEIDTGKRLAFGAFHSVVPHCTLSLFGGRLLDHASSKRWVAQVGMNYEFAGLVNHLLP